MAYQGTREKEEVRWWEPIDHPARHDDIPLSCKKTVIGSNTLEGSDHYTATNHQNSNTQEFLPAKTTVSNRALEHQATTGHLYHQQRCNPNWSNPMPKDSVKKLTKILLLLET